MPTHTRGCMYPINGCTCEPKPPYIRAWETLGTLNFWSWFQFRHEFRHAGWRHGR